MSGLSSKSGSAGRLFDFCSLFKLSLWRGLIGAGAAGLDVGFGIVFAEDGGAGEFAQGGELADVRERV